MGDMQIKTGQPLGCTCDPSLPARKRCTSRPLRCAGAMARHEDPLMPADEEETRARSLASRLGGLTLTRTGRPLTHEELALIASAAEFIEARAHALRRERLTSRRHGGPPVCPRCGSSNTAPLRNFGKPVPGRFECYDCKRWFGPENPPDAGGTGITDH
jgi:hypothetical protein